MVDLDGAFEGRSVNADAVSAILSSVSIPVQLGGGIRTLEAISLWLSRGVSRVILGTAAVRNPSLVKAACARFPGKIAVGIDAKDGRVAVEGWAETSELYATDLARRLQDVGVAAIIYTDIARDGMLTGLNLDATADLARYGVDPGYRIRRFGRHRGRKAPDFPGICDHRRRHRGPGAL